LSDEIRDKFLKFFEKRGHNVVSSDLLVPEDDPTLLFTGAGMNQFKEYFLGRKKDMKRAASCQKCLRTADLENVGFSTGHHTFFEMLGNFSFGDYFKEEAIAWAWEFLTGHLGLDKSRLWVSVYEEDKEAYDIWSNKMKVPKLKIVKLGPKDNFWPANAKEDGPNGPCGPCSEIFYDHGEEFSCGKRGCGVACSCSRFVEIWNLVFTQFERRDGGALKALPNKNIDTGMGLERITAVVEGVLSNFDSCLFKPLIDYISKDLRVNYGRDEKRDSSVRSIADHIRAIVFAIADGVLPSNEEHGYVIRKLIRKAMWHTGRLNGTFELKPFLFKLVPIAARTMNSAYPELSKRREHISHIVKLEEEKFANTLASSMSTLEEMTEDAISRRHKVFRGEDAFKLYDTYGLPIEITSYVLKERGIELDMESFEKELELQKERSRGKTKLKGDIFADTFAKMIESLEEKTKFLGYESHSSEGSVRVILKEGAYLESASAGDDVIIITDKTPFYGESGGQAGDGGTIETKNAKAVVYDTKKVSDAILHFAEVEKGVLKRGDKVRLKIDDEKRRAIARSHTATHLLHSALRKVLGEHAEQSGSLVEADRFRFDFSHFEKIDARAIKRIEELIEGYIAKNIKVDTEVMDTDKAKKSGALALFGEKYRDKSRVVKIEGVSKELCGGTHASATGEIECFKIISESSIASGTRRIEAVTGMEAIGRSREAESELDMLCKEFDSQPDKLGVRIETLSRSFRDYVNRISGIKKGLVSDIAALAHKEAEDAGGIKVITKRIDLLDNDILRQAVDMLRGGKDSVCAVFCSAAGENLYFVLGLSDDLVKKGLKATAIIRKVSGIAGGGGGGRDDLAQAGGRDKSKADPALSKVRDILKQELSK